MEKNRAENFTTVEVDPVSGEHYVIIPEWICDEKEWFEGTEVNIEVEVDGEMMIIEKAKGLDGKACWKGYKLAGTKKKGGKTVDNCVKAGFEPDGEEIAEKKLDPVGKEDGDVDNDGDKDSSDSYLMKRRRAIAKSMGKKSK